MAKRVRIEGDPEIYEVLFESETTMLLVNRQAQHRRQIALLRQQLAAAVERLDCADAQASDRAES
jgi:hypothetical protein